MKHKEVDLFPKKGKLIIVSFRNGRDCIVGQLKGKVCLVVETLPDNEPVKKQEVWKCRVVESFPNVIDICPVEKIGRMSKKRKTFYRVEPVKTIEPEVKKRERKRIQKIIVEKIEK